MKNRKREICTSGTVRDEGGNILIYSAAWQRGSVAGDVRRHAAVLAALAPDVIMAQHLDRDAVAAGEPHLLSRDEWTGGDV